MEFYFLSVIEIHLQRVFFPPKSKKIVFQITELGWTTDKLFRVFFHDYRIKRSLKWEYGVWYKMNEALSKEKYTYIVWMKAPSR